MVEKNMNANSQTINEFINSIMWYAWIPKMVINENPEMF